MEWIKGISDYGLVTELVATVLVVLVVAVGRGVSLRFVRRSDWPSDQARLRVTVQVKRAFYLALLLGLLAIWGAQLRMFALSAFAIAAAIVIGTKELIMCALGSIVRASTRAYTVGDRIELTTFRGDVIDYGLVGTTILEVGPGHYRTGRALTFPNSLLLNNSVVNETYLDEYVLHVLALPLPLSANWQAAEKALLEAANEVCAPYVETARKQMAALSREHGLGTPNVEPKLIVQLPEPEKIKLLIRVPTPAREKGRIEQAILRRVLDENASALLAPIAERH